MSTTLLPDTAARLTKLVAGGFAGAAMLFNPTVSRSFDAAGNFAGVRISTNDVCAQSGNGSCGPAQGYVCGLNGQNYYNMVYIVPR